jgi:hypothetical protein
MHIELFAEVDKLPGAMLSLLNTIVGVSAHVGEWLYFYRFINYTTSVTMASLARCGIMSSI